MNSIHPPSTKPSRVTKTHLRIWGLASGRGRTHEAAKGAFTFRDYLPGKTIARRNDWQEIVKEEAIPEITETKAKSISKSRLSP